MATSRPPATDGARVLLVEDEQVLREAMAVALRQAGFTVEALPDGVGFEQRLELFRPDATVLDVMLPGRSGLALAMHCRTHSQAAIVFVTARDEVPARLAGFEAGADDYVVKPFVLAELVARLRAVLRRSGRLVSSTMQVGDLLVDEDVGIVQRGDDEIAVTATELRLLAYLCRNHGRVLSKTQILTQVWGYDDYDPNLVETYVSTLRRKLEAGGASRLIHTVRGIGYRTGVAGARRGV
ncbi:response regulator transcription factor [Jatrophihabitans sp.]|uniref:response regulator transcription factor n=1 Tax=Jatrophihabitans sp. TaxID=1932789 RepID=UPI0030C75A4A|nr:two component transcriptional regulator, winged helix family [Jatrophihabitans sp.]